MKDAHLDTRQHLIETGQKIMAGKGFTCVGLNEVLQTAGIPKGSFYHYFKSKEQFGQSMLEDYFIYYLDGVDRIFADNGQPARDRLMNYWRQWLVTYTGHCDERRCLVVKLSAEVADLSEAMRITLRDGTDKIILRLADIIQAGIADGSLPVRLDARQTAAMLYQLWLGASLLTKLHRNGQPLEQALLMTQTLLAP